MAPSKADLPPPLVAAALAFVRAAGGGGGGGPPTADKPELGGKAITIGPGHAPEFELAMRERLMLLHLRRILTPNPVLQLLYFRTEPLLKIIPH